MSTAAAPFPIQSNHVQQGVSADLAAANARLLAQRGRSAVTRGTSSTGWLAPLRTISPTAIEAQSSPAATQSKPAIRQHITVYSGLLLAFIKNDLAAAGRVWLLARLIDVAGRGWLDVGQIRDALTSTHSSLRICGWRRLRQILREGMGIFWQRDNRDRLWLRGTSFVASRLSIAKLTSQPIELPTLALLGSISRVKANFYASFHSRRSQDGAYANPISRDALISATGVSKRTQARYDQQVKIDKRQSLAIGGLYSAETQQDLQWQGKCTFPFTDKRGDLGAIGAQYVAWHIPNRYAAVHEKTIRRQTTKNINRKLRQYNEQLASKQSVTKHDYLHNAPACKQETTDLVTIRERGNGNTTAYKRVFFSDGKALSRTKGERFWSISDMHVWRRYEA